MEIKNTLEAPLSIKRGGVSCAPRSKTSRCGKIAAAVAALLGSAAVSNCGEESAQDIGPPVLESVASGLTLRELNPPPAAIPLPIAIGRLTRVSQRARSLPTHCNKNLLGPNCQMQAVDDLSTLNALDFAIDGDVAAPVSGVVTLSQGNCSQNSNPNTRLSCGDNCNGGWGNMIGLEALDGRKFIAGHCDSFAAGLQNGSFVLAGTPLCEIGCTGYATGVHIHFDKTDRIARPFVSQGVDSFITAVKNGSPAIERPGTFTTCCSGSSCEESGATADQCAHAYKSFNYPLGAALGEVFNGIRSSDSNIRQAIGGIEPNQAASNSQWTTAFQRVRYAASGGEVDAKVLLYTGSLFGNGNRNPFLAAGWSRIVEDGGGNRVLRDWQTYAKIHSEDFIKFDLYELMLAHVRPESRQAVNVSAQVDAFPQWHSQWELHRALMRINSIDFYAFLAVLKSNRGVRYGTYYNSRDNIWTPDGWTAF